MASTNPPRRHTVPPVNVVKLMDAIGPTQAAARLSVSTTLLHKAKKDGEINKVVEMAAAHALEHLNDAAAIVAAAAPESTIKHPDALFLLAVPADKADIVRKMADTIGAELVAAA